MDMELAHTLDGVFAAFLRAPTAWSRARPADQIRTLRLERGMSQRHLARSAGVSQSRVCRLEKGGDARWELWSRLFGALGYELAIVVHPSDECAEDSIIDEIHESREREVTGRERRWG